VESDDGVLPDESPSDADLARTIGAAASGSARDAEAELYRRFAPRVRLYGLRHLRDVHAAADLAQQVLLMTIESLRSGRVREPERIASFVLGTCRQVVLDRRRGEARRQENFDRWAAGLSLEESPRPAEEIDSDRLRACLERLAARERSVVVMTFVAERKSDEVAAELGLAAGNVRVIRHRALGRLRACLESEEGRS
jgi:RNA polymerase sigma-70 factor (ECF subfamily)